MGSDTKDRIQDEIHRPIDRQASRHGGGGQAMDICSTVHYYWCQAVVVGKLQLLQIEVVGDAQRVRGPPSLQHLSGHLAF